MNEKAYRGLEEKRGKAKGCKRGVKEKIHSARNKNCLDCARRTNTKKVMGTAKGEKEKVE
jgi:hypothetical protein